MMPEDKTRIKCARTQLGPDIGIYIYMYAMTTNTYQLIVRVYSITNTQEN